MPRGPSFVPAYRELSAELGADRRIAELGLRQYGVVTRAQLLDLGLSKSSIGRRVIAGRLHPRHRGVYVIGYPRLSQHGRWMAAVLACGPNAALSHRSVAALQDLRPDNRSLVDVTTPSGAGRTRDGIRAHWAELGPDEITTVDGIPCTSVVRTLLDLAAEVDSRSLERAVERAEILRLLDWGELRRVVEQAGPRRGVAALRAVVARATDTPVLTRSELEAHFLEICRRGKVPMPRVNAIVELPQDRLEVDFLWPEARLIVETDGHETHGTRTAFARDRRRDQCLTVAGYRVVRFTWWEVVHEPDLVSGTLSALLLFELRVQAD